MSMNRADGRPAASDDTDQFNPIIHAPLRLRMCAILDQLAEAEFGWMMENLDISKSALSKQVTTLVEAGYVEQRRGVRDTRQRVWLSLTDDGGIAYQRHVAALRRIVDGK